MIVGSANLAPRAFEAALIGEYHLFVPPIMVRGSKMSLPHDVRVKLVLVVNAVSAMVWSTSSTVPEGEETVTQDRKSTRLNSSHANISYAVFCLKKKTKNSYPFIP